MNDIVIPLTIDASKFSGGANLARADVAKLDSEVTRLRTHAEQMPTIVLQVDRAALGDLATQRQALAETARTSAEQHRSLLGTVVDTALAVSKMVSAITYARFGWSLFGDAITARVPQLNAVIDRMSVLRGSLLDRFTAPTAGRFVGMAGLQLAGSALGFGSFGGAATAMTAAGATAGAGAAGGAGAAIGAGAGLSAAGAVGGAGAALGVGAGLGAAAAFAIPVAALAATATAVGSVVGWLNEGATAARAMEREIIAITSTREGMLELSNSVRTSALATASSLANVTKAYATLSAAEVRTSQLDEAYTRSKDLSEYLGLDILKAHQLREEISKPFGLSADAKLTIEVITTASEIGDIGKKAAAQRVREIADETAALGLSMQQTGFAAGAFAKIEEKLAAARLEATRLGASGDALRKLEFSPTRAVDALSQLQWMTLANSDAAQQLGLDVTDNTGRLRALPDVAASVSRSLKGMSDAEALASLRAVGLTRDAAESVISLSKQSQELQGLAAKAEDAANAMGNWQRQSRTLAAERDWERLNTQFETLKTSLGAAWADAKGIAHSEVVGPVTEFVGASITANVVALDSLRAAINDVYDAKQRLSARATAGVMDWLGYGDAAAILREPPAPPEPPLVPKPVLTESEQTAPQWQQQADSAAAAAARIVMLDEAFKRGALGADEHARAVAANRTALENARSPIEQLRRSIDELAFSEEQRRLAATERNSAINPADRNKYVAMLAEQDATKEIIRLQRELQGVQGNAPAANVAALVDVGATQQAIAEVERLNAMIADANARNEFDATLKGVASDTATTLRETAIARQALLSGMRDDGQVSLFQQEAAALAKLAEQGQSTQANIAAISQQYDALRAARQQADDVSEARRIVADLVTPEQKRIEQTARIESLNRQGLLTDQQRADAIAKLADNAKDAADQMLRANDGLQGVEAYRRILEVASARPAAQPPVPAAPAVLPPLPLVGPVPPLNAPVPAVAQAPLPVDQVFAQPVAVANAIDAAPFVKPIQDAVKQFADALKAREESTSNIDETLANLESAINDMAVTLAEIRTEVADSRKATQSLTRAVKVV